MKEKKLHYRAKYKKYIGEIPYNYHIHHINENHNDDRLINLIAIPATLHGKYHFHKNSIGELKVKEVVEYGNYYVSQVTEYYNVYNEIQKIQENMLCEIFNKNRGLYYNILNGYL